MLTLKMTAERIEGMLKHQEGQGLVEYALILVLISIAAILIMPTLGSTISGVFSEVISALTT